MIGENPARQLYHADHQTSTWRGDRWLHNQVRYISGLKEVEEDLNVE